MGSPSSFAASANAARAPSISWSFASAAGSSVQIPSSRADLVVGDQTIVVIGSPRRIKLKALHVSLDSTDETKNFALRANGKYEGLIKDIPLGSHVIKAQAGSRSAQTTIFNHANGGPIIAGPQVKPWVCKNAGATDGQCNQPLSFSYQYKNANTMPSAIMRCEGLDRELTLISSVCILEPQFTIAQQ